MANCTFEGHRDCLDEIIPQLNKVLVDLITNRDVNMFYVGNQGRFDAIVRSVLCELKKNTFGCNCKTKYTNFGYEKYTILRH